MSDDGLERLWGLVLQEGFQFVRRRWQPDKIEVNATKKGGFRCASRRSDFLGFESGQDEAVDIVGWPCGIAGFRDWVGNGRLEGPKLAPFIEVDLGSCCFGFVFARVRGTHRNP